jgi:hypothetical protein
MECRTWNTLHPSPTNVTGHVGGEDPILLKKLQLGGGQWHHEKELFGFIVNGAAKMVCISQTKPDDICAKL